LVTAPSVVVGRGGLAPEIEVGPLCLDFPPDGQTAEHEQGKDEQLLHCVGPSSLDVNLAASLPPGEPTATYLQPPGSVRNEMVTTKFAAQFALIVTPRIVSG
jgi:hypothetical protein